MSLVFINHPLETFTPTSSGALATIIWECCRVAKQQGSEPFVMTRSGAALNFDWGRTITIEPPAVPTHKFGVKALRAYNKLTGWRHLRHHVYAARVAAAIRRENLQKFPLVLINDPEMVIYLRKAFPDAFIAHWFQNQLEAKPKIQREYGAAANVHLAVSEFTRGFITDYYRLDPGSVHVLYNAVDSTHFVSTSKASTGKPVINFVGRTGIEKAPDLLLRAALLVARENNNFEVQMLGSNHWDRLEMDDYQQTLSSLAKQLESQGVKVRRPGHISRAKLPGELQKADIHVMTSRWDEPFGMATLEGMATGLATVASRTGGTPEVVGEDGFLFTRDSEEELAGHLSQLIGDTELRADYGRRARTRALQFTWEKTWSELNQSLGL